MKIIYANEEFPTTLTKSLFLAGPTSRTKDVASWRPEALKILEDLKYDGIVFVPEYRDGSQYETHFGTKPGQFAYYGDQVDWEHRALYMSDQIIVWVPRQMVAMPALTTNVEFGLWADSGKIVLGTPPTGVHNDYLRSIADKFFIPRFYSLRGTLEEALGSIGDGAKRNAGETTVPLHIWRTKSFQDWHQNQLNVGNRLVDSKLIFVHRVGKNKQAVFVWAMRVNVFIFKEGRHKTNDPLIARTDISAVILCKPAAQLLDSKIILIREFRNCVSNESGFIWEVPSGSSHNPFTPAEETALAEVSEEACLEINPSRLRYIGSRQLAATFSVHHAHVFYAEITDDEFKYLESQDGIPHGTSAYATDTGEKTFIEIKTVAEILKSDLADWSNVGAILTALLKENNFFYHFKESLSYKERSR